MDNIWTDEEAKKYFNFYYSGVDACEGSNYEIINHIKDRYYGLLKIKLKVRSEGGFRRLHILINKVRNTFEPDCGAYMAERWSGNSDFNSIDCRCELKDALTNEYLEKLKNSIEFEISILEGEDDD